MKQKNFLLGLLVLALVLMSCNYPGVNVTPTPTEDMITEVAKTVFAQMTMAAAQQATLPPPASTAVIATLPPTVTLLPPPTDLPAATQTPIPCNWAQFITETIPDDTQIPAGTGFVKSWQLKNIGTCTWTTAYQLIFVSGSAMGAPAASAVSSVAVPPGGTVDVSVALSAPATAGSYQGFFKLRAPDGTIFGLGGASGGAFWVKITSFGPTATVGPTATSTSAPLPDLQVTAISFNPASPTHGVLTHVSVSVVNAGSAATSGTFTAAWWGLDSMTDPSCTWIVTDVIPVSGTKVVSCDYIYPTATAAGSLTKAQVDTGNTISESNESNNVLKVGVTVQ